MALFFAATFFILWRAGNMPRHVFGFGVAYALSAIGFLITHLLPANAIYLFHTTQIFYTLGSVVMIVSVCERVGQKPPLIALGAVYGTSAVLLGVAIAFSNDVSARLLIVNTGYGVMFIMCTMTLLNVAKRTSIDNAVIAIMIFQGADFLIRPTMTLLFEQSIPAEAYRESIYYSLIGLALGVKGIATAIVLIGATISEWIKAVRENGERDTLTGLRNRGAFEEAMRTSIPRAQQDNIPFSLVVADIDHFKQVNDIWGHQAGDLAITDFGRLIENTIRDCDIVSRIGGEEFCVAVWNCENGPAEGLAERIRLAFARMKHAGLGNDIRLTASFGVATARPGETYDDIFARADAALYRAKSGGRDRVANAEVEPEKRADKPRDPTIVAMKRTATKS